jgi:cell volume regulation protein A
MALALTTFATTSLLYGSGFLAVYVAGLMSGNARLPHAATVGRFQAGTIWLAQIVMFVTLGLLATPAEFGQVALAAIGLALFLMLVARPIAVWLCLLPFRFTRHEMAFISWVGLRGAVSILLAVVPALAEVPDGRLMLNVAFIVVLASLLIQGWSIAPVARFLGVAVPSRQGPVDRIELELPGRGNHEIAGYVVHPDSPVARGERIPRWARPSLVVRDGRTLRPHRFGRPQAGDQIYVITTPEYVALLDKLFAGPAQAASDPDLYGEFAVDPEARLAEIAQVYPAVIANEDGGLSVKDFLRRQLAGDIEAGDRVPLGPVDLIVRRVNEAHEIEEAGLAMEHVEEARPRIPIFQNPKEIGDLARSWLRRARRAARVAAAALPGRPRLKLPRPLQTDAKRAESVGVDANAAALPEEDGARRRDGGTTSGGPDRASTA